MQCPARADVVRKESVLAWGPVEKAGPEWGYREGQLGARSVAPERGLERSLKPVADAAAPLVEPEAGQPRYAPRGRPAGEFPLLLHAWKPRERAKVQV